MSGYICPINKHHCRCDPGAINPKSRPCALAKRIGVFIRMMNPNYDGDPNLDGQSTNAAIKLRDLLRAEGLCNDLAVLIENCNGEIEEKKYSDADVAIVFARGVTKGRAEEAHKRDLPPEFYDADGHPRWNDIALFCQKNRGRLRGEWELTFIDDMAGKTIWREPSEKQAKHLLAIFVRLGGHYDPKATHIYR